MKETITVKGTEITVFKQNENRCHAEIIFLMRNIGILVCIMTG